MRINTTLLYFYLLIVLNSVTSYLKLPTRIFKWNISKNRRKTARNCNENEFLIDSSSKDSEKSENTVDWVSMLASNESQEVLSTKAEALELLDILTSTTNSEDPSYDYNKYNKRLELLNGYDYGELKAELYTRGLKTSGDKIEMMIRILLNVIDPTVDYSQKSSSGVDLRFVSEEDLSSDKVRIRTSEEKKATVYLGPDATDLEALKGCEVKQDLGKPPRALVPDSLSRKEISINMCSVRQNIPSTLLPSPNWIIRAYVVSSRDILKRVDQGSSAVVLLPDRGGWNEKALRVIADTIAYNNQIVVVVPDVFRGYTGDQVDDQIQGHPDRVFDDIVATLIYLKSELNCDTISLAGIGVGGRLALEASSDLVDIAFMLKNSAPEGYVMSPMLSLQTVPTIIFEGDGSDESTTDESSNNNNSTLLEESEVVLDEIAIASRCQQRAIAMKMIRGMPSISYISLASLAPNCVIAWTPTQFNVSHVGNALHTPAFVFFSRNDTTPNEYAEQLSALLEERKNEIIDFQVKSYVVNNNNFVLNPKNEEQEKASYDCIITGAHMIEAFGRLGCGEYLDELGTLKLNAHETIGKEDIEDIVIEATYTDPEVHDYNEEYNNPLLPSDEKIQRQSPIGGDLKYDSENVV